MNTVTIVTLTLSPFLLLCWAKMSNPVPLRAGNKKIEPKEQQSRAVSTNKDIRSNCESPTVLSVEEELRQIKLKLSQIEDDSKHVKTVYRTKRGLSDEFVDWLTEPGDF